ncbi:MAG: peptide deformylase [Ruminococcaceae bacterium]|nr:peptide deformylase [Oscillospiraceae bacterium]
MALLTIVKDGDEVLRKKCKEVKEITPRIKTLIADMIETLHEVQGAGLAAPQVGVLKRIAIVEAEPGETIVLINPKIVAYYGEQEDLEGCLSLPGKWGIVKRPMGVTVTALDIDGNPVTYTGSELKARAFCHEIDHLDGILYKDKATRMLTKKEIKEYVEEEEE